MNRNVRIKVLWLAMLALFPVSVESAQLCKDSIVATTGASGFVLNNDGTATLNVTGLMWMRCSLGQEWDGTTCRGDAATMSWGDALKAAADWNFAGYADWRLPNKNELESIVDDRCISPAGNAAVFPAMPLAYFWTSSPYSGFSQGAWSVDFGFGAVNATDKSGKIHVRFVRDIE
jgi:hypothetical protein